MAVSTSEGGMLMAIARSIVGVTLALILTVVWLLFYKSHLLISIITPIVLAIRVGGFKTDRAAIFVGVLVVAVNLFFISQPESGWTASDFAMSILADTAMAVLFGGFAGIFVIRTLNRLEGRSW
jgi:hypothetical protein